MVVCNSLFVRTQEGSRVCGVQEKRETDSCCAVEEQHEHPVPHQVGTTHRLLKNLQGLIFVFFKH